MPLNELYNIINVLGNGAHIRSLPDSTRRLLTSMRFCIQAANAIRRLTTLVTSRDVKFLLKVAAETCLMGNSLIFFLLLLNGRILYDR